MSKEIRKKEIEIEVGICDICGMEMGKEPFNKKRIEIVRNLFNTSNFDAHEGCINTIVKTSFERFIKNPQSKIIEPDPDCGHRNLPDQNENQK